MLSLSLSFACNNFLGGLLPKDSNSHNVQPLPGFVHRLNNFTEYCPQDICLYPNLYRPLPLPISPLTNLSCFNYFTLFSIYRPNIFAYPWLSLSRISVTLPHIVLLKLTLPSPHLLQLKNIFYCTSRPYYSLDRLYVYFNVPDYRQYTSLPNLLPWHWFQVKTNSYLSQPLLKT